MLKIKQIFLPELFQEYNYFFKEENGKYKFQEGNKFKRDDYDALAEGFHHLFSYEPTQNGDTPYVVKNGVKIIYITIKNADESSTTIEEVYSPNLIASKACYKLGISALPGTKFMINDNENNIMKVGTSGVFNMDFGNEPISSIRVCEANYGNTTYYGTILDIIYLGGEEDDV